MTTNSSRSSHASIVRGLIIAALLLAVSLLLAALSPDHLSPELARRLLGVLMGAVVVVYANAVPKALTPLILTRCDPGAEQAMRRFTGWSLTPWRRGVRIGVDGGTDRARERVIGWLALYRADSRHRSRCSWHDERAARIAFPELAICRGAGAHLD